MEENAPKLLRLLKIQRQVVTIIHQLDIFYSGKHRILVLVFDVIERTTVSIICIKFEMLCLCSHIRMQWNDSENIFILLSPSVGHSGSLGEVVWAKIY